MYAKNELKNEMSPFFVSYGNYSLKQLINSFIQYLFKYFLSTLPGTEMQSTMSPGLCPQEPYGLVEIQTNSKELE